MKRTTGEYLEGMSVKRVLLLPPRIKQGRAYLYAPTHPQSNSKGLVRRARLIACLAGLMDEYDFDLIVHHEDEDTLNDNPRNLSALSPGQHVATHNAKVTEEEATRMRDLRARKHLDFWELGTLFNCSAATAKRVCYRQGGYK